MEKAAPRRRANAARQSDENDVEVRVSKHSPRARVSTPPVARAQNLATALLEGFIGQLADYIENSSAVERLIRVQTTQVLRELAHDPRIAGLMRAQVERYVTELIAHPEILEPLVRVQVDRYLDHLKLDPTRIRAIAEEIRDDPPAPPRKGKAKSKNTKIELE